MATQTAWTSASMAAATGTYPTVQRRQVDELIDIMSPRDVPFLKLVGITGEAGVSLKLEWLEDALLAEVSHIEDNPLGGTAATDRTVNVHAGDGINFQAGMIIKIESEYLYVSAVTADALTVVRNAAGTTCASHVQNSVVEIVGLANAEGSDAPLKGATEITAPYNRFQDFDTSYKITYKMQNLDIMGVPQGEDDYQLKKAFEEVTVKLERTAILGIRRDPETPTNGASAVPSLMGGLDYFVDSTFNTGVYEIALAGAQLTEKDLNDMFQDIFYKVGAANMGKTLIVGAWNKRRINDFYAPSARMARNERTGGVVVDTIDTDFGPIDVVLSLRCPKSTVYLVNLDYISLHPFKGLAFFDEEKASSGAYTVRQVFGSYSMKCKNVLTMGKITGTATSA